MDEEDLIDFSDELETLEESEVLNTPSTDGIINFEDSDFSDPSDGSLMQAAESLAVQESIMGLQSPTEEDLAIGQYVDPTLGKYKQDATAGVPQILGDLGDYRGQVQSTGDKWGNGAIKFVGKTGVNVYGATIGLGQGIYSGVRDGEWNAFYNNEFARDIDKVNEWFDETLPNHYTRLEREKGLWDQMGTANFYTDKVLNGFSFLAGAAITEMGLSALTTATLGGASGIQAAGTVGLLSRGARLFKNAALSNRLGGVAARAGKYVNRRTLLDTGKMMRQLATGAMYESGIEARHSYDTIKTNYIRVALEDKGFDPAAIATMTEEEKFNALTPKERQKIEDDSASASNTVFAGNFGLVGMSNMIMIPKLYGLGAHNILRKIPGGTFLKQSSKLAKAKGKGLLRESLKRTNFGRKALEFAKKPGVIKAGDWARTLGVGAQKGFYEGVIEEGGQGTMQRAAADYALLSGIRDDSGMMDVISSTWDSFQEGGNETFSTTEGLTEVVIGAGLGFLGLPGVNTTLIQAHKDTVARRKTIDFMQELQDKHPDVLSALRANMHFFQNVGKRSSLLDSAYESGDMALIKDLEHDDFYDFVMARVIQEDFQSIEDQAKAISEMSPEEFRAWGSYTYENLPDSEVEARKALVVEKVNKRAKAIKDAAEQVDSHLRLTYREKVLGMMEPGTMGYLRNQLIHSLSVIDNANEREAAMIAELARLTGGTVVSQTKGVKFRGKFVGEEDRTDAIQYVDKDGNTRIVDIGAFSQDGEIRSYLSITSQNIEALEAKKKAGEKTMPLEKLREIDESLENLYADKLALEEALKILSDEKTLSPEEFDEIIAPWKAANPEGAAVNEQEVYRYLTDLRKLRGRRQKAAELYKQLMDPTYRPQAIQNIIEKINHVEEDKTESEKAADKAKTAADKKRLEEFLAKAVEAKKVTKRSILSLEQQVKEYEDLMDLYLSELVENIDRLEKGKVRDKNGKFIKVKPIRDAIAKAEKVIKEGEEILKGLAQDIENQLEVLVSIEELENNPPNLNLYATEMHGSIENMLKATGLANLQEIEGRRQEALNTMEGMPYNTVWDRNLRTVDQVSDALRVSKIKAKQLLEQATAINTKYAKELQEKDVLETLKMSFFQDIKNFRKDETKHLQAMEKAASVVEEQLLRLQGYKEILETMLEEQKKTKGLDLFTSAELDANVAFLNSELLLTDESIKAIKEGDNLGLFNRESMASAALALTAQELENSYTEYYAYTLIESMKTSKDTSPSPNKPSSKRTPSFEDAATTKGVISKLQKADIKDIGFFKTSGGHKADIDKGILQGAIDDFKELSKYDFEDLNESDKKKFLNAKSQLRFFNWIHSHKISSTKSKGKLYSDYSVAAVTIHSIPQELRDLGLTEDLFYDEDDIKLVVFKEQEFEGVDKNKKPTYKRVNQFETDGNGLPIYTSALLPVHSKGEGSFKRDVFRNDHEIPESQKDNITSKYKAWRDEIIENAKEYGDVFLFPVTDKSMGSINLGKDLVQNAGILSKKNDYVNTKLYIGSSAKGLENVVEVPVGTTTVLSRPGLVWAWDNARGIPIPMTGRLLSNAEVDNVALMMHKLLKIRQETYDAQPPGKKSWPDAWKTAKAHEEVINGKKFNLKNALGDIVYTRSSKSEIDKKEYQLVFDKGTFVFDTDDLVIELKDFAEDTEVLAELKKFLATKYHNVNNGTLNNEKEKVSWGEIVLADNADLSLDEKKSTVWKNYNEYLLKDRKGDTPSPLQTRAYPISSNEDPNVLNAPRFHGGYLVFEGDETYRKSLEGVRNKYAAKKGTRKKSTAQEEDDDVVDILNETGSNVETRTDVDTDPNIKDITDLQPKDPDTEVDTEVDTELTDDEVVDIALNNYIDGLTPKGIVDLLQNEDRQDATKQVVINRYIKDDLKVAQTKALEEFFATKEGKRIVDSFTKKSPSTKTDTTTTPTTQPGTESLEDLNDDEVFMTSSYELPSTLYIQETYGEELARVKGMTSTEIIPVIGMIAGMSGEGYAQLTKTGQILISNLATRGALYHETFHDVSLTMLSPEHRKRIYDIVRLSKGEALTYKEIAKAEQDPTYTPVAKALSEFTDKEAEEWLAEEFRRYVLSKGKYVLGQDTLTKKQRNIFQKLFDFIRDTFRGIFGLDTGLEIDPEMTEVKDLFQKIADGGFKNAQRSLEYLNSLEEPVFMQASLIENHQSSIFKADLNSTVTAYFADSLKSIVYTDSQGEEAISSIAFSDFLDTTIEDRNLAINQAYRDAWKKMHVAYTQALLDEKKGTPEYNVIHSAFQTLFDATPGKTPIKGKIRTLGVERRLEATLVNKEYLKTLGVDFEIEDTRDEDEISSKMFSDVIDEIQISPTDSAKGILKLMLGTIPNNTGKTNSTGLKGAYELKTVLKNLQTGLAGTLNYADQLEAIEDLEYQYPWAPQVLERLGKYKVDTSTSIEDILLRVAFRSQFAKTMYDTAYDVLQESGKIYTIDPSLERNLRGIRTRWNSYLRIKSKKAKHISIDPQGNIVFDPDAKANFKNRLRTLKGVYEHVKSKSPSLKLDALEHIGIVFSNREEMEDILKYNPETTLKGTEVTYLEAINDALAFVYKDLATGSTSLAALFDRGEAQSVTRMNALAKMELETTTSDYELQHQNPEGKLVYSISLNNYLSTIANLPAEEINKYFASENSPFKNPYAFSSLTIKALKSDPSSKISIVIREGLGIEGPGQTGVKASKLRTTDKLVSYIESIMQGNMPMIQAADIATNFAVKFPIRAYKDINSLKEVMLGYLTDEIVTSATALDENVDVEYFTERVKRLRMFESLIGKADSSVKEGISKLMLDPKTSRGKASKFVQEHADNLFASIESNLRLDMDALIAKMEDLKVVVKNTDGSYNLLGLNRDRFDSTLPDNVTEQQLRNFVEEVVARQTVYKNELFKVFFGDPAFYKAVFKRFKGAVGTKDIFYTGPEVDKFLNTKNPRVDIDGTISNGEENLVVIKEPKRITPFLEEFEKSLSPKVAEAYAKAADKSDGSFIVTLPAYREMAIRGNTWSPSLEKIYENVMERGDTVTEEIMGKFPPLKFQYFGYLPSELNTQVPGFFKMSVAPIYPQLGEIGDKVFPGISNMYEFLTENKLGGIVLPSAFKIGVPGENSQLELMEGDVIRTPEDLKNSFENSNSVAIDYRFMGTQLEVPSKFKYTSPLATQARTQVMSDLFKDGKIRPEFAELEPTVTRYNAVLNGLIGRGYKELLTELNLDISKDKDGNPIVGENGAVTYEVINGDYSKFINAIKDESIRREMPPQILSSLDALERKGEEDLPVYFDAVSNKGRLEGVLWSLAGKRVIRQRFKGDMYVQQSSLGFETVRYRDLNTDELGEEFAEPLKPYTIGDQYMEVYAPHYFKEFIGRDIQVTKDGLVSNGEVVGDLSLLKAIGIRIPTDGIHSIEAIRIKNFLPRSQGATVVIPSEMVTKSGSDFDIDKLVMYFPSYKMRGNQIIKEKFYDSLEEWYNAEQRILNRNMRALEEMESVMDSVEERDQLIKMLTDSFTSKIFGKDIATELFKDSKEDMSAEQADRLANYFNSNPEEIRKSYARIQKIINQQEVFSKPFEEWQAKNPEATVYNSQSKGAMQNAIMDDMVALLQAKGVTNTAGIEERYDTWMQPVNIDDITAIAEDVSSLFKGDKSLSNLSEINDYHLDTTIPNLMDVSEAFDKGKVLVGIEALASTHHVKSQIAGLELNADNQVKLPNNKQVDISINFEGFDPKALVYSLSGVTDVFGRMRISDVLSQLVNASVDVVNNPILHKLNITPDNANMWSFLIRVGVPVRSIAMFANQPIVRDYLKLLEIGRSQTMKAMKDAQYDDEIFEALIENYGTDSKVPTISLTAEGLESLVGKSLNDVDPELKLTEDEKAVQLQVLEDMFMYSKVGEHLGNVVTRQSFDTKIPKSRNHLRITLDMYNTAVSTGLFNNVQNIAGMEVPSLEGQPTAEVTEGVSERYSYKEDIVNKFDTDVDTIINGMRNVSIADNIDYNIELEIQKAEENNLKYFISTDSSPEAIETFGKPVESYTFYNEKGKDQAEIIHRLETEDLNISNEEKSAVLGYMLQYNLNEVSDFTGISIEDIETLAESLLAPKGTTDTFMRSMTAYNYSMQNIFNEIFLTEKQNSTYQKGFADIQRIFSNPELKGYSIEDRANILNKYENGFISFIAQNLTINRKTMIGDNIESLMFGDESIAITFQNIQDPKKKHPLKMNPFINSLIGNISPAREGKDKTNDYLQPVNRTMTPFEMKTLHDAFREIEAIDPKLAKNIIKTALLQAGVGSSTVSFLNTIPGDSVLELMGPYLDVYKTGKSSVQFEELLANYYKQFFKNNHNNPQIVPKHTRYSKKLFPYTYLITKESKKAYAEASKRGLPAPKVVKVFFRNEQTDSGGNASNSFERIPTSVSGTRTLQILKDKLYIPANAVLGKQSKEKNDEDENNCEL